MTRPTSFDVRPYIGRPFDAVEWNCWILVATVLNECFGLNVPTWKQHWPNPGDRGAVEDIVQREQADFIPVSGEILHPGDIVQLRITREVCHVGIIHSGRRMLHVMERTLTCLADLDSPEWRSRVHSFHRHPALVPA